ncbi:MAG TPA: tetratricopeptide repeat protein [Burkholderiaceae bacterium]|nr:tetratricopeptide repeat protein [Burkholderiaceae bacterium]
MKWHYLQCLLLGVLTTSAHAQMSELADAQWQALYEAHQYAQLEQQAQTYLQAHPDDPQAVLALALAAGQDAEKGKAVLTRAQDCVARDPKAAPCYLASGMLMSKQIAAGGPLTAMRYGAAIGNAFERAVQLQPAYFPARSALIEFYLGAPRIVGGGIDKARVAARATPPEQADYARILRGQVAAAADQNDVANGEFGAVHPGADAQLARWLRLARVDFGFALLEDKQYDQARAVFDALAREQPDRAEGYYGLGRCALQNNDPQGAIAQFEKAQGLPGGEALPLDQRLGQAYAAKGDKQKAKALLERFLRQPNMSKGNVDMARKLLAELS